MINSKIYTFFLASLICVATFANETLKETYPKKDKNKTSTERYYPSSLKEGYIGVFDDRPLDSPTDNVFTVAMDAMPADDEEVWLTYDLYGISDHTGISRSINNQLSAGGYLVALNHEWQKQEEQLKKDWLQKGDNIIRFTLPENAGYNYRIKNLGLRIVKKGIQGRAVIINQPLEQKYVNDLGYLKGFVQGKDSDRAQVFVDDMAIYDVLEEFEALIPKPAGKNKWVSTLKVVFPDGETLTKQIAYTTAVKADYQNTISVRSADYAVKRYSPEKTMELSVQGAAITIAPQALTASENISITTLRVVDIPALDGTMVNVTKKHKGYRFLPHGTQFKKEATIHLDYDSSKIPDGYTPEDIKTYYFDEKSKHWVALKKDSLDTKNNRIISKTTHFTDMINGIIKVPESPETAGFTPTSIKDIKAANPSAAINTIEPPSANNMGSANIGYPITLPAGRQGMQPQLGIQYNSSGSNDWLGMGWNLQIPAINIDTRWGVPRYDAAMETETYTMGGQMMAPVAHRGAPVARTSEKQFHPRVEGSFNKIIRHGDNPTNYWWEVTDKSGTIYSYGGISGLGIVDTSVLKDADGNIAHWALVEVRDLNDNFVRYHCTKVLDVGVQGGSVPGQNIYIDRITYTGHGNSEGKYEVLFTRDRELNEAKRTDVTINARYGFKQVTADLLKKIEVQLNGQNIRSYELTYVQGAFYKTLLQKITEFDANGQEFTNHEFDYFDDVRPGATDAYVPYSNQEEHWTPQQDGVHGNFINPIEHFNDDASALGANKSNGGGGAIAVTAGINDGNLAAKSKTAGVSVGFSKSKNEGLLALVDINGDGLSDKVFKTDDGLFFRANQSGPDGTTTFSDGEPIPIVGITNFNKGRSSTTDFGIESHFVVFAGVQYSKTKSTTSTYFSDVNGDQLIDIVSGGIVYFNHIDDNGIPTFTASSAPTPSPINASDNIDPAIVEIDPAELEAAIDQNPLHDVVKVWEAPYDGTVSITENVQLVEDTSSDRQEYTAADGVRVAIQHIGTELWSTTIAADDYTPKTPTGVDAITVTKGDRIYFRVQSVFDGAYDQVQWTPTISYTLQTPDLVDANNLPVYEYNSGDDFIISAPMSTGMAIDGEVTIEGTFIKPITTDDVTVEIIKETNGTQQVVWQQDFGWNTTVNQNITLDQTVLQGETFYFKVLANTNIDWAALQWNPKVYYTVSNDPNITQITDTNGNPVLEFYPTVDYSLFNVSATPTLAWEATQDETVTITPQLALDTNTENGTIVFSIKKSDEWLYEQEITVTNGVLGTLTPTTLDVATGDKLYLEYHIENKLLADVITSTNTEIAGAATTVVTAGLHTKLEEASLFGVMYRNWGQFTYNGNRDRATQPINEAELVLDDAITNPPEIDLSTATTPEEMEDMYDTQGGNRANENKFIYMIPNMEEQAYVGYDDLTYVKKQVISASRLGEDDILPINPLEATGSSGGTGATAIKKVAKSENVSFSVGIGPAGLSYSKGNTIQEYDYIDMNGDRHPDIVSKNKIQYTLPTGGLEPNAVTHAFGRVHLSEHEATGFTLGGTFLKSGDQNSDQKGKGSKSSDAESESKIAAGISGNFNTNNDETQYAWMDINGDGLPDRVYTGGEVELNLGYKFAPKEQWGYVGISDGDAISYGAGLNINLFNYSLSVGIGLSRSESDTKKTLQDVNGDGLLDYIVDASPLVVAINTGNGFATPIPWTGADAIREGVSTGESANGSFTACIPILLAKLCFNPSANVSHGVSREKVQIADVDGDGFPDFLRSDKDNDLTVYRSTIARTNLLMGVKRPLGASFAVDYKRVGNTYGLPNDVWSLAKVELHDGFEGDGADTMVSTFEYEEGRYDRNERDFYGFKTVKSHQLDTESSDAVYRTVVQEFKTDNYYEKGALNREVLQDASENLYTESLNTYELKDIGSGTTLPDTFKASDDGAAFLAATEMTKNFYEGQGTAGKSTRMTYSYDLLGNVTSYTDFGDDGIDDDISSSIAYHSVPSNYIMGIPSSITVSGGGQTYRKRETSINTATGNITQIRKYLQTGGVATYDMDYDGFGNLTKITRPENANRERLFFEYTYDPEVNTYTTGVTDGYGYSSSSDYDYRFGQLLLSTDLNGQQMRYEIDNVGRITTITGPFEMAAGLPYTIAFEYHPEADVPWAGTKHYDPAHPDNDLETITFIDGLKRSLQVKKDGAIHSAPNAADDEQMIVSGRLTFDAFGRTIESYYPVTEPKGGESDFNDTPDGITPTKTTYDVLDRALTVTLPDNAVTTTVYGFGSDRDGNTQFSTKVTDANGIYKESFTNVRGLTKAVQEQYSQGSDIWTSYAYNPINELIEVKDDQDNVINSSYDWLGRRTEVVHPDAGITKYEYDLASNLTKKITANLADANLAIGYTYDHERLTNITYPQNPQNNVTYTYGASGAPNFRAGRIVTQEDATGAQEFFYNELGAVVKNIRTIIVPDSELLTYTTQWEYDTWNRITSMIYPDQETLTYNYNLGGLLHSFSGQKDGTDYDYVKQLGYDKFEQRVYLGYGNGTETFYNYEPDRRRLKTMVAETATDRKMMDNVYTYDKVNNILRLQNNAEIPTSNLMGGQTDYNYTYDDLYRLTNATGSHLGSNHENKYSLAMEYNSIHSIVKKDQLHEFKGYDETEWSPRNKTTYAYDYEYGEAQPHAPIHIGEQAYTYDANGNQTGWMHDTSGQQRQILWDEENRIKAIADNGALFNYVYDAGGERVLKSNGGGQNVKVNGKNAGGNGSIGNYTIYVNPYVVIRNSMVTKHFYIESQRVVTKLAESSDGLLQDTAGDGINYTNKTGQLQASIAKLYADMGLEVEKVDGEAGNSGKIPPGQSGIHPDHPDNGNNGGGNDGGSGDGGTGGNGNNIEAFIFYYHPDHLGSSSYITDANGEVSQHIEYFAFGETFLEEHSNTERTPYLFNGKELDEETGLYYYGARYYDAKTSVWQSVDLEAEKYPNVSPYAYVANNPINSLDPDGRYIIFIGGLRLWHGARDQAGHVYNGLGGKTGIYKTDVFKYWSTDENTFGRKNVDIAKYYQDKYQDEKIGFTSGSSFWNSQAADRKIEGMEKAKMFHEMVQNGDLKLDANETIKIVSHSQGGAHAAGFAEQLMTYTDADGNALYKIEIMEYITPHQPTDIYHPDGIKGIQYSHENDQVSSRNYLPNGGTRFGRIKGIEEFYSGKIMGEKGQPRANVFTRGGHNVTDNDQFIKRSEKND